MGRRMGMHTCVCVSVSVCVCVSVCVWTGVLEGIKLTEGRVRLKNKKINPEHPGFYFSL